MSTIKYQNGMYKSTSPSQEEHASKMFSFLKLGYPACTMGYRLNQNNGHLTVNYYGESPLIEFSVVLNRHGKIIKEY
jgi:hypothetical protein